MARVFHFSSRCPSSWSPFALQLAFSYDFLLSHLEISGSGISSNVPRTTSSLALSVISNFLPLVYYASQNWTPFSCWRIGHLSIVLSRFRLTHACTQSATSNILSSECCIWPTPTPRYCPGLCVFLRFGCNSHHLIWKYKSRTSRFAHLASLKLERPWLFLIAYLIFWRCWAS